MSRVINSVSVFRMGGRDLTFDGIGRCAGSTWADGGGRQARPGAGKRQRIYDSGHEAFWGGYTGVFVDPDGHPWEVAYNPGWTIGPDGSVTLPDTAV